MVSLSLPDHVLVGSHLHDVVVDSVEELGGHSLLWLGNKSEHVVSVSLRGQSSSGLDVNDHLGGWVESEELVGLTGSSSQVDSGSRDGEVGVGAGSDLESSSVPSPGWVGVGWSLSGSLSVGHDTSVDESPLLSVLTAQGVE